MISSVQTIADCKCLKIKKPVLVKMIQILGLLMIDTRISSQQDFCLTLSIIIYSEECRVIESCVHLLGTHMIPGSRPVIVHGISNVAIPLIEIK